MQCKGAQKRVHLLARTYQSPVHDQDTLNAGKVVFHLINLHDAGVRSTRIVLQQKLSELVALQCATKVCLDCSADNGICVVKVPRICLPWSTRPYRMLELPWRFLQLFIVTFAAAW